MKLSQPEINIFPSNGYSQFNYDYFIGHTIVDKLLVFGIFSKENFSLIKKFEFNMLSHFFCDGEIIFYDNKENYGVLNMNTLNLHMHSSYLVPEYKWNSLLCYFNQQNRSNEIRDSSNKLLFSYQFKHPIAYQCVSGGILEYFKFEKTKNWIRCLDPNGGREKWKISFSWKIARLEVYENLIILNYLAYENIRSDPGYEGQIHWESPNEYTIVIDSDTGKEVWRLPFRYHFMDRQNGIVLTARINEFNKNTGATVSASAIEIDIKTGKILTDINISPMDHFGYKIRLADTDAIYYSNHYFGFGKIRKNDGVIEWEFNLTNEKGEKNKIVDFILLGNKKLLLSSLTEPLIYIFDPYENLEYSTIKTQL